MTEIEGVCPIIATPFTETGDVDYDSLRNEVRTLSEGGVHALALFGIAGEFFRLSDEERTRIIDVTVEECEREGVPLVVSVTHDSTEIAVQHAVHAENAGADCIMVYPPNVLGPPTDGIYNHLEEIGNTVDVPVMVQYAPDDSGIVIDSSVFVELSNSVENVRYFKIECTPPGPYITNILEQTDDDCEVLVGNFGFQMIEAFDRGASGVMPGASFHERFVNIYEAYADGNREDAFTAHSELVPILNHISQVSGIRYHKKILAKEGTIETEYCRKPLVSPDEQHEALFEEYYERLGSSD